MFKSLKTKILASMILLTSVCTAAFMGVSFFAMKSAVTKQMKSDGTNLVTVINREIGKQDFKNAEKIATILKEIKDHSKDSIKYISLTDTNSRIIASSDNEYKSEDEVNVDTVSSASVEESDNASGGIQEGKSTGYIFKTELGDRVYNVSTPFYEGGNMMGTISVGISLSIMNETINMALLEVFGVSLIILIIAIVVGRFISGNITTPITNVIDKLDYLSKGDFTVEFESEANDETRKLTDALNKSIHVLKEMLKETKQGMIELGNISNVLKSSSENVEVSSRAVSDSIVEVASGIEEQDNNVSRVAKALESFSVALEGIQQKVQNTTVSSMTIESSADVGAEKLKDLIKSIEDVRSSFAVAVSNIQRLNMDAKKINDIMNVINSVAEQTNLLALNAAIEAARAGEAGRGFSVVADEIRKLAEKVMDSSRSINGIILGILSSVQGVANTTENISEKMDKQINIVDNTMVAFNNIQSEVHKTIPQIKTISEALKDVVTEEETIMSSVEEVSAISEQISASTQEISSSVQEHVTTMEQLSDLADNIDEMANRLNKNIDRFKV